MRFILSLIVVFLAFTALSAQAGEAGGIPLQTNFDPATGKPLDKRQQIATLADTSDIAFPYEGLQVFVVDTKTRREYVDGVWGEVVGGGGLSEAAVRNIAGDSLEVERAARVAAVQNIKEQELATLPTVLYDDYTYRVRGRGWYDVSDTLPNGYIDGKSAFQIGSKFLILRIEKEVTINQFGAVANDGNDDTQAINDAIDFAVALGFGGVNFGAGQYDYDDLSLDFPAVDNFTISGEGKHKTVLFFRGTGFVNMVNQSYITLSDMTVTGDAAVSILIEPTDDKDIESVRIENVFLDKDHETMGVGAHGIVIDGNRPGGAYTSEMKDIYIVNTDVVGAGHPSAFNNIDNQGRDNIYIRYYPSAPGESGLIHNIFVTGCRLEKASRMNFTVAGLRIGGASSIADTPDWREPYDVFVSDCHFLNSTWAGADIEDGDQVYFNNVHWENSGRYLGYYNAEDALSASDGQPGTDRAFRSAIAKGGGSYGVYVSNSQFTNCAHLAAPPLGSVFTNCEFVNTPVRNGTAARYLNIRFQGCSFIRDTFRGSEFLGDHLVDLYSSNLVFDNCKFRGPTNGSMIRLADGGIGAADEYTVKFSTCEFTGQQDTFALVDYGNVSFSNNTVFRNFEVLFGSQGTARNNQIILDNVQGYNVHEIYRARSETLRNLEIKDSYFDGVSQITSSTREQVGNLIVSGNKFNVDKSQDRYLSPYFLQSRSFDFVKINDNIFDNTKDTSFTLVQLIARDKNGEKRKGVVIKDNVFTGFEGLNTVQVTPYTGDTYRKGVITNNDNSGLDFLLNGIESDSLTEYGNGDDAAGLFLVTTPNGIKAGSAPGAQSLEFNGSTRILSISGGNSISTAGFGPWVETGPNLRYLDGSVSIGVDRSNLAFHVVGQSTFGRDLANSYTGDVNIIGTEAFSTTPSLRKTLMLFNPQTAADGIDLASLMFGSATLNRGFAGITAFQDGSDPDRVGLRFYVHPGSSGADPLYLAAGFDRIGRLFLNRMLTETPVSSPEGLVGYDANGVTVPVPVSAIGGDGMGDNDAGGNEVTNADDATAASSLTTLRQLDARIEENVRIEYGNALPEGVVTADFGTLYISIASGTASLWLKETGTGNTGWIEL